MRKAILISLAFFGLYVLTWYMVASRATATLQGLIIVTAAIFLMFGLAKVIRGGRSMFGDT